MASRRAQSGKGEAEMRFWKKRLMTGTVGGDRSEEEKEREPREPDSGERWPEGECEGCAVAEIAGAGSVSCESDWCEQGMGC